MKKTAIVTGCAYGIGKSIALDLARDGYNIIGTYNTSQNEIEKLKIKIESIGVKFDYYKADFLNDDEIENLISSIKVKYDKIDLLINNASKSLDNTFDEKTKQEFIDIFTVNLIAPFLLIQGLKNELSNGTIINISSTDGINTYSTLNMDYSASKAALINLTKSLALELKDIKVYALCPNWVETDSILKMNQDYLKSEMKRIGQLSLITKEEVSAKVLEILDSNLKSGSIIVMEESREYR